MTLCVCGHPSADHAQFDHGEYCFSCECRDWRPIHKEAVDSEESTAPLSAGVTPEGLAEETVAESVNEAAERLRATIHRFGVQTPSQADSVIEALEDALATERRNTVERIVDWLADNADGKTADTVASIFGEVAS